MHCPSVLREGTFSPSGEAVLEKHHQDNLPLGTEKKEHLYCFAEDAEMSGCFRTSFTGLSFYRGSISLSAPHSYTHLSVSA